MSANSLLRTLHEEPQAPASTTGHVHIQSDTDSISGSNNASDETRPLVLLAIVCTLRLMTEDRGLDVDRVSPSDICAHCEDSKARAEKIRSVPKMVAPKDAMDVAKPRDGLSQTRLRTGMSTQSSHSGKHKLTRRKRKRLNPLSRGCTVVEEDAGFRSQLQTVESPVMSNDRDIQDSIQAKKEATDEMRVKYEEDNRMKLCYMNSHHGIQIDPKKDYNLEYCRSSSVISEQEVPDLVEVACLNPKPCSESKSQHDYDKASQAVESANFGRKKNKKNVDCKPSTVMSEKERTEFDTKEYACQNPHMSEVHTDYEMYDTGSAHHDIQQTSISVHRELQSSPSSALPHNLHDHSIKISSYDAIGQTDIQITDAQSPPRIDHDNANSTEDAIRTKRSSNFATVTEVADEGRNEHPRRTRSHVLPSRFSDSILQPYWGRQSRTIRRKKPKY